MIVKRIVPNRTSSDPVRCRAFYAGLLGLGVAMDLGWVTTYAAPSSPAVQLTVLRADETPQPAVSVEVDDMDAAYREATERGCTIVYPLTDEPWGVRRVLVADPNGVILNILSHARSEP